MFLNLTEFFKFVVIFRNFFHSGGVFRQFFKFNDYSRHFFKYNSYSILIALLPPPRFLSNLTTLTWTFLKFNDIFLNSMLFFTIAIIITRFSYNFLNLMTSLTKFSNLMPFSDIFSNWSFPADFLKFDCFLKYILLNSMTGPKIF